MRLARGDVNPAGGRRKEDETRWLVRVLLRGRITIAHVFRRVQFGDRW